MYTTDDDTTPFVARPAPAATTEERGHIKSSSNIFRLLTNRPFMVFIFSGFLSICSVYVVPSYEAMGPIGMLICLYGLKHFHTIIALRTQVSHYHNLNITMRKNHCKVERSVDQMSAAKEQLSGTHDRLQISNQRNRENLQQFRGVQDNMSLCNAQSIAQLQTAVERSRHIERRWHEQLFQHERHLLQTVFDRFCTCQNNLGMSSSGFEQFSNQLPDSYSRRFMRMGTFKTLAGGKDVILLEDFEMTLDIFAEMQANDCDIEFEFKATEKARDRRRSMAFLKRKQSSSPGPSEQRMFPRMKSVFDKLVSKSITEERDDDDEDSAVVLGKLGTELLDYERKVIITKRSGVGHCSTHLLSPRLLGSPRVDLESPPPQLKRTRTRFDNANILDLTLRKGTMPDFRNMATVELENYTFTDVQMDQYMTDKLSPTAHYETSPLPLGP